MWQLAKKFSLANRQTKFFILTWALYIIAIIWTTLQVYARLDYSRSDRIKPIVIERE